MQDFGSGGLGLGAQTQESLPKVFETLFAEWIIDPIIHPVTSHQQLRPGLDQDSAQALMQIRTWKCASGMTRFGQAGNRLTGQSHIDELDRTQITARVDLEIFNVLPAIGDAVS